MRPLNSLLEEDVSFDHTTTAGKNIFIIFFLINKVVLINYYFCKNYFYKGLFLLLNGIQTSPSDIIQHRYGQENKLYNKIFLPMSSACI